MRFGHLLGNGEYQMVLAQCQKRVNRDAYGTISCLTAMDLDGNILWQYGEPTDNMEIGNISADMPMQIYDIDGDGKKEIVYAGYDELGSGYPRYVICSIGIRSGQKFYVKAIYDLTCFDYTVAPDKAKYVLQHGIPSMAIKSGKLLFQVHDYDDKDKILNTFTMTGQQGDHLVFNTESGRFVTSDWEDFDKEEDKN